MTMFDFIRNLSKSAEQRTQEQLTAYVDGELNAKESAQFERKLAADATLQADVEAQQRIKNAYQRLPRSRAPRHFTLDPAVYGKPVPDRAGALFPVLRTATALAALFLFVMAGLTIFQPSDALIQSEAAFIASPTDPAMAPPSEASESAAQGLDEDAGETLADAESFEAADEESDEAADEAMEEEVMEEGAVAEEAEPADEEMAADSAEAEEELTAPRPESEPEQFRAADVIEATPPPESTLVPLAEEVESQQYIMVNKPPESEAASIWVRNPLLPVAGILFVVLLMATVIVGRRRFVR